MNFKLLMLMEMKDGDNTHKQSFDMIAEMGAPGYIQVLEQRLGKM